VLALAVVGSPVITQPEPIASCWPMACCTINC
jgi:hypothetical protein